MKHLSSFLVKCPMGTYHAQVAEVCAACERGTFQNEAGQTACKTCPEGTTTTDAGARRASQCLGKGRIVWGSQKLNHCE